MQSTFGRDRRGLLIGLPAIPHWGEGNFHFSIGERKLMVHSLETGAGFTESHRKESAAHQVRGVSLGGSGHPSRTLRRRARHSAVCAFALKCLRNSKAYCSSQGRTLLAATGEACSSDMTPTICQVGLGSFIFQRRAEAHEKLL